MTLLKILMISGSDDADVILKRAVDIAMAQIRAGQG